MSEKWKKIATWSVTAFAVGVSVMLLAAIAGWPGWLESIFQIIGFAGFVMTFVSAPKLLGGLRFGVIALISGACAWIIGMIMKDIPKGSTILGVEFPAIGHPLYEIGWTLVQYGALAFVIGLIMAAVSYLRRVLRAVEGKSAPQ